MGVMQQMGVRQQMQHRTTPPTRSQRRRKKAKETKRLFDELGANSFFFEARASKGNWVANKFNKYLKDRPKEKRQYDKMCRKGKEARRT